MEYLPPLHNSTDFNAVDFNYQDQTLTVKNYEQLETPLEEDLNTNLNLVFPNTYSMIVGKDSGNSVTADMVTVFGRRSGQVASTDCTYIGTHCGRAASSIQNTFVGSRSGETALGGYNTAMGYQSMWRNEAGTLSCTAVGTYSQRGVASSTTGDNNTSVGANSLYGITTGGNNTTNGFNSGYDLTTGSNNVLLGYNAGTATAPSGSLTTQDNRICLGDTNITDAYIQVSWTIVSDTRDKTDIEPIDDKFDTLDYINNLEPKIYKMNDRNKYKETVIDEETGEVTIVESTNDGTKKDSQYSIGFLSQEVETIENLLCPNTLTCNNANSDKMGIRYEALIPILVGAIKKLSARVEALENI